MKVYIGIDWSQNKHDLCFLNEAGAHLARLSIPHTPVGFWNDDDGSRYRAAYFERFEGVWAHGDFAELERTQMTSPARGGAERGQLQADCMSKRHRPGVGVIVGQ